VVGNAFHATGPKTEKARSPSLVRVLDTTNFGNVDDRRPWRWVELATDWTRLVKKLAEDIMPVICHLCNTSLECCRLPDDQKLAVVRSRHWTHLN